ncbi:MAG TPA: hypothetical protein V6C81_18820 [Planktothrix sp.]|jgi:hypothetical protein
MPNRFFRSRRGSTLVLAISILLGVVMVFILFALSLNRFVGSHHEQRTAIEAAALVAARDLSRIVVEDPYFGFVSLSDSPPIGTATECGDNYYVHSQGINTIFATIRLDMIIADLLNNKIMKACAQRDYQNALSAKDELVTALNQAIAKGGSGTDINGTIIHPVDDAITEYEKSVVRMTEKQGSLSEPSLKLTLGWEQKLDSNTTIPHPSNAGSLTADQQDNGYYRAFVNIPYDGYNFVFTATGDDVSLADFRQFSSNDPGLPYSILDIVKCEADESVTYKDEHAQSKTATMHNIACAQPACLIDKRPQPGALCLNFPNGRMPEIGKLGDLLLNSQLVSAPVDWMQTPLNGDYPGTALSNVTLPLYTSAHPPVADVMSLALYDWMRRAGTAPDLSSLMSVFNQSIPSTIGQPTKMMFTVSSNGTVTDTAIAATPTVSLPTSQNQYRIISGEALRSDMLGKSNTDGTAFAFDVIIKDFTYLPGRTSGGKHAGEPFGSSISTTPAPPPVGPMDEAPAAFDLFPLGPGGGAVRPTYQSPTSTAAEITFRQRM